MADIQAKIDASAFKAFREKIEDLKKPIDKATAEKVQKAVVSEMKTLISKGNSPIAGKGKFPPYKNPKKYPGKRKAASPVNLELSGEMLRGLGGSTERTESGYASVIEYTGTDRDGVENSDKEEGHRLGTNDQPKRPTIPIAAKGENFVARILKVISDLYKDRLRQLKL